MKAKHVALVALASIALVACNKPAKVSPSWPQEQINKWLKDHNCEDLTIPGLPEGDFMCKTAFDEGIGNYLVILAEDNGTIGVDSYEDQYKKILEKANWTIDDSNYARYGYVTQDAKERVGIQFYDEDGTYYQYIYSLVETEPDYTQYGDWPSSVLANFLTLIGADPAATIPACTSGDWYGGPTLTMFGDDAFELYTADDGTILSSYLATLKNAGWKIDETYSDEGFYDGYDPTKTVYIVLGDFVESDGEIGISFSRSNALPTDAWPEDQIKELLESFGAGDANFPKLEGEFSCVASFDPDVGDYLTIGGEDNGTPGVDALEDTLKAALEADNWEIIDKYYDDYGYYAIDPSLQVECQFYSFGGEFVLYIYKYEVEELAAWPVDAINTVLANINASDVVIPTLEGEFSFTLYNDDAQYPVRIKIYAEDNGTPGVNALEDAYKELLINAGWEIDDTDYAMFGYYGWDSTHKVRCNFYTDSGQFMIQFYKY